MKAKFLLVLLGLLVTATATGLHSFLGLNSSKVRSRSVLILRFLTDFINLFEEERRKNFVFILEGPNNILKRSHNGSLHPWSHINWFQGRFFMGGDRIRTVLKEEEWNKRTLFVVLLTRDSADDKFYVGDMGDVRHQNFKGNTVMKTEEIARFFGGDVLPNGRRRTEAESKIKTTLQEFWEERIFNVIVAKPQKSRVYTYTFFPYTEVNCAEHLVPVLVNVWFSRSRTFFRDSNFFPDKIGNLFGCRLNVSLVLTPPGIIFNNGQLTGIEGNILTKLFDFINATPNFLLANDSGDRSATSMGVVLNDIKTGLSDIGAGFLVPTKNDTGSADCVYVSVNLCLTWAVPNRAKIKNFTAYILETFSASTWGAIGAALSVSGAFSWLLVQFAYRKPSSAPSCTRMILPILGQHAKIPENVPNKVFLAFFLCFSVLVSEIFQAGLGSNNIIVQPRSQLDTIEDVVDSGLQIKGAENAVSLFNKMGLRKGTKAKIGEIKDSLMRVGLERRTVYIGYKLLMKYHKNILHPELRRLIHIHRSCLVTYQPFLALKKNSPFSERVSKFVTAMAENGYSNWLYENFTKFGGNWARKNKREEVDMILFYGGMQIWLFGMVTSFVAFLCELVFARSRKAHSASRIKHRRSKTIERKSKCQCKDIRRQEGEDKPSSI